MNKPTFTQPLLSVVVPAYNEEVTLSEIVARLLAVEQADEIVIVDDCSTDEQGRSAIGWRRSTQGSKSPTMQ